MSTNFDSNNDGIAVIGMAGRFPGAKNLEEFWANLIAGKESITYFSEEELMNINPGQEEKIKDPNYIKARGVIDDIDKFDAEFFGYLPMDAKTMDPQHRIWLETAWNALEDAGCDPARYSGSMGVFVGSLYNTYLLNHVIQNRESLEKYLQLYDVDSFQIMINNDGGFLPTKTAYKFNLRGPAINVQTACSTSLVSIAQACQSLFSFESDACIAGGVSLYLPQELGYSYHIGAITSPDGHCRPFDANSNGTVPSNGVGAVVLKRLEDAIADNDHIYAVIKGWGINNDGNKKVSYMAPSVDGQAEVVMMAQDIADVHPEDISYIETHGTATPLGDPIEIAALTKAFHAKTDKTQFCAIGSVKSNMGHLDAAAGVTGFIKTVLSAYHQQIPPTINYKTPNPKIDFTKTPFYVLDKLKLWKEEKPLIMGVSSFGIGGTNCHIIIQEHKPKINPHKEIDRPQLVLLSAKSEGALSRRKDDLLKFCTSNQEATLQDIAYTLQVGRTNMPYKSFGVFTKKEGLKAEKAIQEFVDSYGKDESRSLAFLFPGQGAQYLNMGKNLYETEPFCKEIFDECFNIFKKETGVSLKDILFVANPDADLEKVLSRTEYTQPSLFIIEYTVAKYFENFGIKPEVLIGHSIGEYAAACISGVFSLEDALKIIIRRGQLMQKMPSGKMMVVKCDVAKLNQIKSNLFEIAAVNAPGYCTISFKIDDTDAVNSVLQENSIDSIHLNTSHAFHSSAFDPILDEFAYYVDQFTMNLPKIPFISCYTGNFADQEMVKQGRYWANQLRNTVLFNDGINAIVGSGNFILLEVGPNTHLTSLAKRIISEAKIKCPIIPTLSKPEDTNEQFKVMFSIGQLWSKGIDPDFELIHNSKIPNKIVLPSYSFEPKSHWIEKANFSRFSSSEENRTNHDGFKNLNGTPEHNNKQQQTPINTVETLKQMLCELSGIEPIEVNPTITFTYLGLESLFLAQYAQAIEKKFKINVKFRQLIQEFPNLELLSKYIDQNRKTEIQKNGSETKSKIKPGGNLVIMKPDGQKIPFIMVFGDICNTYLPKRVSKEHPYWGFMHSGSDGEKIEFTSIEEMAKSYVDELVAYKPEGPYFLGGYSFGGIVAFEMGIQLRKRGMDVPLLIMVDSLNPLKRKMHFSIEGATYVAKTIYKKTVYNLVTHKERGSMPLDYRNAYIMDVYSNLWKKYKPTVFDGNVTLFKSSENRSTFKYLGWDEHSSNVDLIELTGDHMQIIRETSNIDRMVNTINEKLHQVQQDHEQF